MNREIKFRGINDNGKWVYGCYFKDVISNYIRSAISNPKMQTVNLDTVGQFTGLKDKNGMEVYEGDIVKLQEEHTSYYVVEWHQSRAKWIFRYIKNSEQYYSFEDIENYFGRRNGTSEVEIIGNIYENPELLDGGE